MTAILSDPPTRVVQQASVLNILHEDALREADRYKPEFLDFSQADQHVDEVINEINRRFRADKVDNCDVRWSDALISDIMQIVHQYVREVLHLNGVTQYFLPRGNCTPKQRVTTVTKLATAFGYKLYRPVNGVRISVTARH